MAITRSPKGLSTWDTDQVSKSSSDDRPKRPYSRHPPPGDRTSTKLRSSCRSCSDSKVRCDKGKPTCSRCHVRGIKCMYLRCKRPGRVPGSRWRAQTSQTDEQSTPLNDSNGDTVNQVGTVTKGCLSQSCLPSPPTTAIDLGSIATGTDLVADSLFTTPGGVSDIDLIAQPSTVDNYQEGTLALNNMVDRVDSLDPLSASTTNDVPLPSLMDTNTDLNSGNTWWPFDISSGIDGAFSGAATDKDAQVAGGTVSSCFPYAPMSDTLTESSSLPSSSLSSVVNLMDLENRTSSSMLFENSRSLAAAAQQDVSGIGTSDSKINSLATS